MQLLLQICKRMPADFKKEKSEIRLPNILQMEADAFGMQYIQKKQQVLRVDIN